MKTPTKLYVAWQDPIERHWFPVGLVTCTSSGFEFAYVEGARRVFGSTNFPGLAQFPDLESKYTSPNLFAFLQNRVVARSRDDYSEYARRLGLGEGEVVYSLHPFDLLGRSNGRRLTDRFEVFAPPLVENGIASFLFFTRGVRYLEKETQTCWEHESPSKPIVAEMEPDNPFDPNAVMLFSNDHTPIGHVPRYYTAAISSLLRVHPKNASFELVHHNQEPAPPGERFLIQAKILVPEGWTFDVSGELAPIKSAGANAA